MKKNKKFSCLATMLVGLAITTILGTMTLNKSMSGSNLLSENVEALTITIEGSQLVDACERDCVYSYFYNCILYTNIGTITCLNGVPRAWL